jgi:chemotaxis protein histidine kinase CheA
MRDLGRDFALLQHLPDGARCTLDARLPIAAVFDRRSHRRARATRGRPGGGGAAGGAPHAAAAAQRAVEEAARVTEEAASAARRAGARAEEEIAAARRAAEKAAADAASEEASRAAQAAKTPRSMKDLLPPTTAARTRRGQTQERGNEEPAQTPQPERRRARTVEQSGPPREATRSEPRPPVAHVAADRDPKTRDNNSAPRKAARSEPRPAVARAAAARPAARTPSPEKEEEPETAALNAASPTVAAMAGQTLALQASSPDGPLYFDGGAREGKAAFGVWKSDAEYTGRLLGNETAQTAEVAGLAACMAIALGMARRGAKQITIRGDSHYALATAIQAYETVLAQPGRSPQHRLWKRIAAIRAQIPAGCALQFEWLPRAANTKADHICTSLLRGTVAAPGAVQATPAPATIEMTNAVFEQIAARALEGKLGRNIRSIPPRLTVLWRAVVEGVVAWSPAALFLAPLVLLQKAGPPLRARLLKYVSCPSLVRMAFAAAAAGSDPPEEARKTDRRVIIEKLAAIAPGKALKAIRPSEPPVDLQAPAARAAATAKVHATPATIEEVSAERAAIPMNPARLPATSPELIATIVKRDLAHAASPGPDGWTRELLLASFSAASKDAFAAIVNGWLGEKSILPPVVDALARASAVVAWKKPAANGLRVVGMTGALAKAAWKIAIATYFSTRAPPRNNAAFAPAGAANGVKAVNAWIAEGRDVLVGDVVDAYYATRREQVISKIAGTAVAPLARWVYGGVTPLCVGGGLFSADEGLLPGCAGAALLFAIASEVDDEAVLFADDIAAPADVFPRVAAKLAERGFEVSKIRRVNATEGGKYLGAAVGGKDAALEVLRGVLSKVRNDFSLIEGAGISRQGMWAMFRALVRGIIWNLALAAPAVVSEIAGEFDEFLWLCVLRFARVTAEAANDMSRRLFAAPHSATGLALPVFAIDHALMNKLLFDAASWPPRPPNRATDREIRTAVRTATVEHKKGLLQTLPRAFVEMHTDEHDWLGIPNIHRSLRIGDDAWINAFRERLYLSDPKFALHKKCGSTEHDRDHWFACHRCWGCGWFTRRHNVVQEAFRQAARATAILTSAAFRSVYDHDTSHEIVPDLIVFDGDVPTVIDFSIAHQSARSAQLHQGDVAMKRAKEKEAKYANWRPGDANVMGLVVTTRYTMHHTASKLLVKIAKGTGREAFVMEAKAQMKVALINFEAFRVRRAVNYVHVGVASADA